MDAHTTDMVATIDHPNDSDRELPVECVAEASHRGVDMVQVEAVSPRIELTDKAGELPWVFADEVEELAS
jgi:hypothetical protein